MKGFLNWKIGAKLLAGFILVALIAGAMGVFAIINIKMLDDADTKLYRNMTEPLSTLGLLSQEFQRSRVNSRDLLLAADAAAIADFRGRIDTRIAEVEIKSKAFSDSAVSPEMIALCAKLVDAVAAYKKETVAAADLFVAGDHAEAQRRFAETGQAGIASRTLQDLIDEINASKVEDARLLAEANTKTANSTMLTMIIVLIIVMGLAILLGVFLSSIISKPIQKALAMIQELSKGHLGMRLSMTTRDEVGQMAQAMDAFADTLQNKMVRVVQMIAAGDLSADVKAADDKDEIAPALATCIANVKRLVSDADLLAVAAVEGRLDTRADASKHGGDFRKIVEGVNRTLDSVIGPLNVAAEYVDRISKGDIPPKITDKYNGDFNEIKNNLNLCIDAVNALVADANMLAVAAVEGRLDTRADATKHGGDFRKIVEGVNRTLDSVIGPLNVAAEYVDRISKGDIPPKITDKYNGDFNEIKNNLNQCIDAVNALVADAAMLSKAAVEGKLDTRADATKHGGDFQKIVIGVNQTLDSVIGPLNVAAEYVDRISKGDIPPKITDKYNGDFNAIKNNLNVCIDAVNALVADANMLAVAAVEGRLDTRADATKHGGDFRKIVEGVNRTLDSVIGPLNVAAEYVDRISKGDIPPKITDKYNGDFNEIKNNLNLCIDAVNALVADADLLVVAAVEGRLDTRADATKHGGDFRKIVEGVNRTLDSVIGPLNVAAEYVDRISKGDIPPKITDKYNGDFNAIKNNLNVCIDAVNALVADANLLVVAAVEGRLDTRADATKHGGDFRKIVEGVNRTLDSVIGPLNVAAEYVDRISKGDIPTKITDKYNGDFNAIKNNLNVCIDAVNALVADANLLSVAAVEGRLSTRADATKHGGDFRKIVEGVNRTLDAVVEPVNEAASVLKEMSQGNLQVRVRGDYKGDHAEIKRALNSTLDSLSDYVNEIASTLSEMANGNMDNQITGDYRGDFSAIKEALNLILESLNQTLGDINNSADQVAAGSRQVSDGSQALSQGATEQAASIEQLTASINDIANQTRKNALSANEANELAVSASQNAGTGNRQMKDMLKAMEDINVSSTNISKIIKVIDEIAFQTNILALNAAVEAARAGQHGKGFAVVAEEVRNLAARSASAAKETTGMIEGSIQKVEAGTRIANDTAVALDKIVTGVTKVADLVSSIATASNDQATGIAQINQGVEQVSKVIQTNSATAEESAAASEELSSQADLLKDMVSRFRLRTHGGVARLPSSEARRRITAEPSEDAPKSAKKRLSEGKPKISLNDRDFGKY